MELEESYRVLRLKPGASREEVRASYYELINFFHPDRHLGSAALLQRATEETQRLNLAYDRIREFFGSANRKPKYNGRSNVNEVVAPPTPGQAFIVPSCGVSLNWVAPGRFLMGSPTAEAGRSHDEGPQVEVTISRGFWLGTFPVTQEDWRWIAAEVDGANAAPSFFHGDRMPVEQVSWDDTQNWLQGLNRAERESGRSINSYHYRLPTEAEWEFACRGRTTSPFHFDPEASELGEYAWYSGNSGGKTHPAGEKKANDWGFYDMHGNVWEWCHDRYGPLPDQKATDPKGPDFGINRVFRGGSWGMAAARCRSAYRVWNKPSYRDYTIGFRIALAPTD